jgi:hypothetical protein
VTGTAAMMRRMATLNQKIKAEPRVRRYTCVRFFFHESKTCLVFDIDEIDMSGGDS